MKNPAKSALVKNPAISQDLPARLAELEAEIRPYPSRSTGERSLKTLEEPMDATMEGEKVVQFSLGKKVYAAGHADLTYAGSNHARGVRHIRFYAAGKTVLDIEGDFEDQQFGSNFRFQNIDRYLPGEWEADLVKLTEELRHHAAKRKAAFKKKRDAEHERFRRGR